MRRVIFALTSVFAVVVTGLTFAQEAADEENVEYEALKVLEPLVGKFHRESADEETGVKRESIGTLSWTESKKMLVARRKIRKAEAGEDLSKQEWSDEDISGCYVWNNASKRIEWVGLYQNPGAVAIFEVTPKPNGLFKWSRVRSTLSPPYKSEVSIEITKSGHIVHIVNIKRPDGTAMPDMKREYKRVPEGE